VAPIRSAPELYAHAIAIEQEAAARYAELDPALRALAREMALEETEHINMVERLLDKTPEPVLDSQLIFAKEP